MPSGSPFKKLFSPKSENEPVIFKSVEPNPKSKQARAFSWRWPGSAWCFSCRGCGAGPHWSPLLRPPQHWDDTSPTTGTSPPGRALASSFLAAGPAGAASKVLCTLTWMFPSQWGSLVSPRFPSPHQKTWHRLHSGCGTAPLLLSLSWFQLGQS